MPKIHYPDGSLPSERDFQRVLSLGVHSHIRTIEEYRSQIEIGTEDFRNVFRNEVGELSPELIREGHYLLFKSVHPWAGSWRREDVEVGGFFPLAPDEIEDALKQLHEWQCAEIVKGPSQEDYCANIGEFHCRFENIHPFMDGNKRLGRLLMGHQMNVAFGPKPWVDLDATEYFNALTAGRQQDYKIMAGLVDTILKTALSLEQAQERIAGKLGELAQQEQDQDYRQRPTLRY